jgi:hypothetical protein
MTQGASRHFDGGDSQDRGRPFAHCPVASRSETASSTEGATMARSLAVDVTTLAAIPKAFGHVSATLAPLIFRPPQGGAKTVVPGLLLVYLGSPERDGSSEDFVKSKHPGPAAARGAATTRGAQALRPGQRPPARVPFSARPDEPAPDADVAGRGVDRSRRPARSHHPTRPPRRQKHRRGGPSPARPRQETRPGTGPPRGEGSPAGYVHTGRAQPTARRCPPMSTRGRH